VSYLIAAYALVIGTLAAYGWRVQSQRRQLMRQTGSDEPGDRDEREA
jgi:hypothetical protein